MSDSTLRVIQKLLSRAEATEFESERDSCLAKVAELMARHSIEEALVRSRMAEPSAVSPTERLMVVPSPYAARKVSLFGAVGEHAGCTVIDLGNDDTGVRRVGAVGFPADLDRMEVLVTSLLVQLTRSMLSAPGRPNKSAGATAAWRRSFVTGFIWRVAERLRDANKTEATDAQSRAAEGVPCQSEPSVALALVERQDAVDEEVSRRYPYLRTRRMDGGSSRDGHHAGRAAGDRAGLGQTSLGSRRELSA